ncbi:uncharacterized protein ACNS7B_007578 [Menidia menidia]
MRRCLWAAWTRKTLETSWRTKEAPLWILTGTMKRRRRKMFRSWREEDEEEEEEEDAAEEDWEEAPAPPPRKRKSPPEPLASAGPKRGKISRREKKNPAMSASAEEFGSLLDENADSRLDSGGLNAMATGDRAGLKQLRWEVQRDEWIHDRDAKTLRRRKAAGRRGGGREGGGGRGMMGGGRRQMGGGQEGGGVGGSSGS